MNNCLNVVVFLFFTLSMCAQSLKSNTCYLVESDTKYVDLFWSRYQKTFSKIVADTSISTCIVWIEIQEGSNNSKLMRSEIIQGRINIEKIENDIFVNIPPIKVEGYRAINIFKLIKKIETGNYTLACTIDGTYPSNNAYFIFDRGRLVFSLFIGRNALSKVSPLDKVLCINAITLIEGIFDSFR
ncbi:hypothetical protein [Haliscomenobacter sp.]|uniref:hypothetical protein n=1 Tax=Haliscomenobacter sp. TaxID=2717303 RepID=UPI00336523D3